MNNEMTKIKQSFFFIGKKTRALQNLIKFFHNDTFNIKGVPKSKFDSRKHTMATFCTIKT